MAKYASSSKYAKQGSVQAADIRGRLLYIKGGQDYAEATTMGS